MICRVEERICVLVQMSSKFPIRRRRRKCKSIRNRCMLNCLICVSFVSAIKEGNWNEWIGFYAILLKLWLTRVYCEFPWISGQANISRLDWCCQIDYCFKCYIWWSTILGLLIPLIHLHLTDSKTPYKRNHVNIWAHQHNILSSGFRVIDSRVFLWRKHFCYLITISALSQYFVKGSATIHRLPIEGIGQRSGIRTSRTMRLKMYCVGQLTIIFVQAYRVDLFH